MNKRYIIIFFIIFLWDNIPNKVRSKKKSEWFSEKYALSVEDGATEQSE